MKKIDFYKSLIDKNISILKCPKCGMDFALSGNAVKCSDGHCFDISGKGYLNFMVGTKIKSEQYHKELFASRQYVFDNGFFRPLLLKLRELVMERYCGRRLAVADIGCGEGSAIEYILNDGKFEDTIGVGIDISKQGINAAASRNPNNILWIVGDLANMPFKPHGFDVVLNMLSPANYAEFDRIVKNDGIVIKVLPGENYLKEMRAFFYGGTEKENYSNDKTLAYFKNHYAKTEEYEIRYEVKTNEKYLLNLMNMSPLSAGKDGDKSRAFVESGLGGITVDFKVVTGI